MPFYCQPWSSFSFSGSKLVGLGSCVPFPEPVFVVHCAKSSFNNAFCLLLCIFLIQVESSSLGLSGNDICPVGHFCPSGAGYPVPCPPGSFSTIMGLEAEEQCQPCPAGRYCSGAGLSDLAQTSLCNAGCGETVTCLWQNTAGRIAVGYSRGTSKLKDTGPEYLFLNAFVCKYLYSRLIKPQRLCS